MRILTRLVLFLTLLQASVILKGQSFDITLYNFQNGFNRSYVNDIVEDTDGYVWLATESGVVRFDGMNFIEVNMPADSLWTSGIRKLYRYENALYALCYSNGMYRIDLKNYQVTLVERDEVADVLHTDPSTLLLLLSNGTLKKRINAKDVAQVRLSEVTELHHITQFKRVVYVSLVKKGVFKLNTSTLTLEGVFSQVPVRFEGEFEQDAQHFFYVVNGQLFILDESEQQFKPSPFFIPEKDEVNKFKCSESQQQFFLDHHKYFGEIRDGRKQVIPLNPLQNFDLRCLLIAENRNVLIGSNQGLIRVSFNRAPFTLLDDNQLDYGNALRVRRKILSTRDQKLILLGSPTSYLLDQTSGKAQYISLNQERFNIFDAVWVGDKVFATTEGQGIVTIDVQKHSTSRFRHTLLDQITHFISLYYDSTRSLLVTSSANKLYVLNMRDGHSRSVTVSPPRSDVMEIFKDTVTQRYLLATSEGIVVLDSNFSVLRDLTGKEGGIISKTKIAGFLIRRNTRELWVAHDKGCMVLDADTYKQLYALPENIFVNSKVFSILQGPVGRIWMGTYNGLIAYDPVSRKYIRLGKINSLINQEFNYKSATVLPSGQLIFGGLNGYDIIESELLSFDRNIQGRVTGYQRIGLAKTVFTREGLTGNFIRFNTEDEVLRVFLAADQSFKTKKLTFEYNLDDEQWISLVNNSVLNIYFLRQGYHKLNIRAFDEYGSLVNFPIITLLSEVPFYKTPLFLWSLVLISLASLFLYILSVIWSNRREEQIKEKISMDLHDEVGTVLTRAMYVAQYGEASHQSGLLKKYLSDALHSLRTFINTMNIRNMSLKGLVDDIREMMLNTLSPLHIKARLNATVDDKIQIPGELYRDLRLILYELQSNMVRHAAADELEVELIHTDKTLKILFRDNGKLTHTDQIFKKGNGIANIQKRVLRNHGMVKFAIGPGGKGLEVTMEFPIQK